MMKDDRWMRYRVNKRSYLYVLEVFGLAAYVPEWTDEQERWVNKYEHMEQARGYKGQP